MNLRWNSQLTCTWLSNKRKSPSRYIKSLAEKRRAREAHEAAERAAAAAAVGVRGKSAGVRGGRVRPLKAFSEVQPKVSVNLECLFEFLEHGEYTS